MITLLSLAGLLAHNSLLVAFLSQWAALWNPTIAHLTYLFGHLTVSYTNKSLARSPWNLKTPSHCTSSSVPTPHGPPPLQSCPWAFLLPHGKHLAAPDKRGGSTLNQKSVPVADLSHHEGHRPYTACRLNLRSRSRHSQGDTVHYSVSEWASKCVCVCRNLKTGSMYRKKRSTQRLFFVLSKYSE